MVNKNIVACSVSVAIMALTLSCEVSAVEDAPDYKPAITGADVEVEKNTGQFDKSLPPIKIEKTGNLSLIHI